MDGRGYFRFGTVIVLGSVSSGGQTDMFALTKRIFSVVGVHHRTPLYCSRLALVVVRMLWVGGK